MKKIDVNTALEVNGECGIINTFKVKEKEKTEKRKMKGMLSTLIKTKNENFGDHK